MWGLSFRMGTLVRDLVSFRLRTQPSNLISSSLPTDLPMLVRRRYANNASAVDLTKEMPGHVDIPRLKKGKVGGFFWYVIVIETSSCDLLTNLHASRSTYVSCPDPLLEGRNFLGATWRVRDTLEQIDIAKLLIEKYPDVCLPFGLCSCSTSTCPYLTLFLLSSRSLLTNIELVSF